MGFEHAGFGEGADSGAQVVVGWCIGDKEREALGQLPLGEHPLVGRVGIGGAHFDDVEKVR